MNTTEQNKDVVRQLIAEVMNSGDLDAIDRLYDPRLAPAARRWIEPFLTSFSDVHMRIKELVAEGDTVVARMSCSGTHTSAWLGHEPTGRRFANIAEVYFFRLDGWPDHPRMGTGRHAHPAASARIARHRMTTTRGPRGRAAWCVRPPVPRGLSSPLEPPAPDPRTRHA